MVQKAFLFIIIAVFVFCISCDNNEEDYFKLSLQNVVEVFEPDYNVEIFATMKGNIPFEPEEYGFIYQLISFNDYQNLNYEINYENSSKLVASNLSNNSFSIKVSLPTETGEYIFRSYIKKGNQVSLSYTYGFLTLPETKISSLSLQEIVPDTTLTINLTRDLNVLQEHSMVEVYFNDNKKSILNTGSHSLTIGVDEIKEIPDSNKISIFIDDLELITYIKEKRLSTISTYTQFDQDSHYKIFQNGKYIYIGCGLIETSNNTGEYSSVFHRYDIVTNSWTKMTPLPYYDIGILMGFSVDGITYAGNPFELYSYFEEMDTWATIQESWEFTDPDDNVIWEDTGWRGSVGVEHKSEWYSALGFSDNNFYKYNPSDHIWTKLADYPGSAVKTMYVLENKLYLMTNSKMYSYNTLSNSWETELSELPEFIHSINGSFIYNNNVYILIRSCRKVLDGSPCVLDYGPKIWKYDTENKTFAVEYDFVNKFVRPFIYNNKVYMLKDEPDNIFSIQQFKM